LGFNITPRAENPRAKRGDKMSMEYCHDCDIFIDTDFDVEHFFVHCVQRVPLDPNEFESYQELMEAERLREEK
jgi:hypothetical protein